MRTAVNRPRKGLVTSAVVTLALLVSVGACTHDDSTPAAAPTSSSSAPPDSASTADTTQLDKANAPLQVSIGEMKGGVEKSRRAAIMRAIGKPINAWMDAAYLAGDFPHGHYTMAAFPGWTSRAAQMARGDKRVTTNAAVSNRIVSVVADERFAKLYVFAIGGLTGGATARILMRMTAEEKNGHRTRFAIGGEVYLTRKADRWRIFGYDLHRMVLRS